MEKTNKLTEYTDKLTNLIDTFNDMKYENNDLINEYTNDKKLLKTYILKLNNLLNNNNIQDNNLININTIDKLIEWCKIMVEYNYDFIIVDRINNCYNKYSKKQKYTKWGESVIIPKNDYDNNICFTNIEYVVLYPKHRYNSDYHHTNELECTLYKIYENDDYKFFISTYNGCNYNQHKKILESVKEYIINNNFIYPDI